MSVRTYRGILFKTEDNEGPDEEGGNTPAVPGTRTFEAAGAPQGDALCLTVPAQEDSCSGRLGPVIIAVVVTEVVVFAACFAV